MSRLSIQEKNLFTGWNYAHRGLHSKDKTVPENSLAAFRLAREAGYGAELDVQLSSDGQVVVFHDDGLKRVCGIDKMVNEYPYEELHKMHLLNTEETIPLFTDVLETFYGAPLRSPEEAGSTCKFEDQPHGGPLVVELKSAGPMNDVLCRKTYDILKRYKGVFCIESFDPQIVLWFKKNAPEIVRGQLSSAIEDYADHKKPVAWALANCMFSYFNKPDFIAYDIKAPLPKHVKKLLKKGTLLIGWTSHDPSAEKTNDGVIFEFYNPPVKYKR